MAIVQRRSAATSWALDIALVTQTAQAQDRTQDLTRVIVTGSQIPRSDAETALPVQVIKREEIERSGAASVEELIGRLSAQLGTDNEATGLGNGDTPGLSDVSLRGLQTLALLNGRRVANYAFSSQLGGDVDLHAIPLAAIERIEVLKDGASAIYGSDAVAGVVNFVLRRDFRGAEVGLEGALPKAGAGERLRRTLSLGTGDLARDGYKPSR
jgi:iron complex outermembrane receptor protein